MNILLGPVFDLCFLVSTFLNGRVVAYVAYYNVCLRARGVHGMWHANISLSECFDNHVFYCRLLCVYMHALRSLRYCPICIVIIARTPGMAKRFLDTEDAVLDSSSRKIRTLCEDELVIAATKEVLPLTLPHGLLFALLSMMGRISRADTQSTESINSLIRLYTERTPNLSLELLSSRVFNKKWLTHGSGKEAEQKKTWKAIQPFASQMLTTASTAGLDYHEVLDNERRWAMPLASDYQGCPTDTDYWKKLPDVDPRHNLDESTVWAAGYNLSLVRKVQQLQKLNPSAPGVALCIRYSGSSSSTEQDGRVFFLVGEVHDYVVQLVPLRPVCGEVHVADIVAGSSSSAVILRKYFADCAAGKVLSMQACISTTGGSMQVSMFSTADVFQLVTSARWELAVGSGHDI